MMTVAAWRVWVCARRSQARWPLAVFFVQLALNLLWSGLFFGLRRPDLALLEVAALIAALAATILLFRRVSAAAAWLLAPYLLWIGFAAALNLSVWRLNS